MITDTNIKALVIAPSWKVPSSVASYDSSESYIGHHWCVIEEIDKSILGNCLF